MRRERPTKRLALGGEFGGDLQRPLDRGPVSRHDDLRRVVVVGCLADLALREGVDMPIVEAVCRLLAGEAPARAIVSELLSRPLKAEQEAGA